MTKLFEWMRIKSKSDQQFVMNDGFAKLAKYVLVEGEIEKTFNHSIVTKQKKILSIKIHMLLSNDDERTLS